MPRNDRIVRLETLKRALLSSRQGVYLKALAEKHDWNLRALYRDIDALEDAGYAITHEGNRYQIIGSPDRNHGVGIPDADERLALYLAREQARPWKATSLGQALDRLWNRVAATGDGQSALFPVENTPWITTRDPSSLDLGRYRNLLVTLERAIRNRLVVNVRYRAVSTGQTSSRTIEPGELYWDPGLETLYLIAWCRLRADVRVFAVHRFLAAVLTDDTFHPHPETRSKSALHKAFRVWRDQHVQSIKIWFSPDAANEIRERTWVAEQKLEESAGGVILTGEVAGLAEVERWILSYGESAKVLAPKALEKSVIKKLRAAVERYSGRSENTLTAADKGEG
jgi:proteasome accessory factor B